MRRKFSLSKRFAFIICFYNLIKKKPVNFCEFPLNFLNIWAPLITKNECVFIPNLCLYCRTWLFCNFLYWAMLWLNLTHKLRFSVYTIFVICSIRVLYVFINQEWLIDCIRLWNEEILRETTVIKTNWPSNILEYYRKLNIYNSTILLLNITFSCNAEIHLNLCREI